MKKKWLIYVVFFTLLLLLFYVFVFWDYDFSASKLKVINASVPGFSFTDQNGQAFTQNNVDGKVYVAEYFFTTCRGICPKMNANMRRVFDAYKDEPGFAIVSHTCMPETDSVPLMKAYEKKMINGKLLQGTDGLYKISMQGTDSTAAVTNPNWFFVTGDKEQLYKLARQGYMIDNDQPDSTQNIANQFIHTQFFALMDKNGRLRGIYDGLRNDEVEKMIHDIKDLLGEKIKTKRFMNGFGNNPG
ncbi:MAG: SCO family protein [Ferruginibacter sp.]